MNRRPLGDRGVCRLQNNPVLVPTCKVYRFTFSPFTPGVSYTRAKAEMYTRAGR